MSLWEWKEIHGPKGMIKSYQEVVESYDYPQPGKNLIDEIVIFGEKQYLAYHKIWKLSMLSISVFSQGTN